MKFEKLIKLNDIFDRNLFILNDNEDLFCKVLVGLFDVSLNYIEKSAVGVLVAFFRTEHGIDRMYSRYIWNDTPDKELAKYPNKLKVSSSYFYKNILDDFIKEKNKQKK